MNRMTSLHTGLMALLMALCLLTHLPWLHQGALTDDEQVSLDIATGTGFRYHSYKLPHQPIPLTGTYFTALAYDRMQTPGRVVRFTIADNGNGLFYNLSLHYWLRLLGVSLAHARLFSLLSVVVATGLIYWLALLAFKDKYVALLAGLLMALHPLVNMHSLLIRGYAFSLMWISLLLLLTVIIEGREQNHKGRLWLWLALGVCGAVLVLIHYFNAVPVVFSLLYLGRRRHSGAGLFVALLLPLLAALVWFRGMDALNGLELVQRFQAHVSTTESTHAWLPRIGVATLVLGPLSMLASVWGQAALPNGSFTMYANLLLMLLPLGLVILAFRARRQLRPQLGFFAAGLLLYMAFSIAASLMAGHIFIFQQRFWLAPLPYAVLLLACALVQAWRQGERFRLPLRLLVCLLLARAAYSGITYTAGVALRRDAAGSISLEQQAAEREPYEVVAGKLVMLLQKGDTILYRKWRYAQSLNWFMTGAGGGMQRVDSLLPADVVLQRGGKAVWSYRFPERFHPLEE